MIAWLWGHPAVRDYLPPYLVRLTAARDQITVDRQTDKVALVRVALERPSQGAPERREPAPAFTRLTVDRLNVHWIRKVMRFQDPCMMRVVAREVLLVRRVSRRHGPEPERPIGGS